MYTAIFACCIRSQIGGQFIYGKLSVDVRGLNDNLSPTYHCQFHLTNRQEMVRKVRDRIMSRHKQFLRFKAPVYYLDDESSWKQASNEHETLVWVSESHNYMLFFPHNFNVLSLGTMRIITDNFWISYRERRYAWLL